MTVGISVALLAVIIVAAVVFGAVAIVVAMESGMWFGFGHMNGYNGGWMHNGNYVNGTWRYGNGTGGWRCH